MLIWTDKKVIAIEAIEEGLFIRSLSTDKFRPYRADDWKKLHAPTAIRSFARDLPLLQQNDLVEPKEADLLFSYSSLYQCLEERIELFDRVISYAPLALHVTSKGVPGQEAFVLVSSWSFGGVPVYPRRTGAFLELRGKPCLMDQAQFESIKAIDDLNSLDAKDRTREVAFRTIGNLHRNKNNSEITLDSFLESEIIIEPLRVGVGIQKEGASSLSLFPVFNDVDQEAMRQAFMQVPEVEGVYDLPRKEGGRVRLLLSDDIQDVLKDLQKARHVSGDRARRIEEAPTSVLREGVNRNVLDDSFSPRVIGLTETPISQISGQKAEPRGWIKESDDEDSQEEELENASSSAGGSEQEEIASYKPTYRHLDILKNEETVDFEEGALNQFVQGAELPYPALPKSLVKVFPDKQGKQVEFALKRHQLVGVAWLQSLYKIREVSTGCLLADDMGLGKTLQLLTFLASVVEGDIESPWSTDGPFDPILIVAPMILFDTWSIEIDRFFDPSPFGEILHLHGSTLKSIRRVEAEDGHELKLEESVLDLEKIRAHKFVLTNYETVRNYQHSFAKVQWSIVVADEAQEIKTQSLTAIALKALKAHFKIAATGTPVENRLLDLWNILDFVQPGSLLGSALDFKNNFETPISSGDVGLQSATRDRLRVILGYNRPNGAVLRRDKQSELKDLPTKTFEKLQCVLTAEELELYADLCQRAATITGPGRHLSLVTHDLKSLSNHPRLYKRNEDISDPEALLQESPKLQRLMGLLKTIRKDGEKALIFSDRHRMQAILAEVIEYEFKFRPTIINSLRGTGSAGSDQSRAALIREFENVDGFNAIILSPQCAGVGLTITGANHVVHYGRWWNPAIENQATDRAYRIGQNKPVKVYHIISHDPTGSIPKTFDQILDSLLTKKSEMATDFLIATSACEVSEADVISEALKQKMPKGDTAPIYKHESDIAGLDPHVFEELCGLLLEKKGYQTVLNARSNDGGIDLFAWNESELKLIQCKHSQSASHVDVETVEQLLGGSQMYQKEIGRIKGSRKVSLTVMSNGTLPIGKRFSARNQDIELILRKDLWKQLQSVPMSFAELSAYKERRCATRKEALQTLAEKLL